MDGDKRQIKNESTNKFAENIILNCNTLDDSSYSLDILNRN